MALKISIAPKISEFDVLQIIIYLFIYFILYSTIAVYESFSSRCIL